MSSIAKQRPTQAERRLRTEEALMQAVMDLVAEEGWGQLRSAKVAARAGVSLGAMTNLFPTKDKLAIAAATRMADQYLAEFDALLQSPGDGFDAFMSKAWEFICEKDLNVLWLETLLAARTDPELHAIVQARDASILPGLAERIAAHLAQDKEDIARIQDLITLGIYMTRGMILEQLLQPDDRDRARLYQVWRDLIEREIGIGPEGRKDG